MPVSDDTIAIMAATIWASRPAQNDPSSIVIALMDAREIERELDRFNRKLREQPLPVMEDDLGEPILPPLRNYTPPLVAKEEEEERARKAAE